MSTNLYGFLADLVAVLHFAYAATIVLGLLLILVGRMRKWDWVRRPVWRIVHLVMIAIVVYEAWAGITCPLTVCERDLRNLAGQPFDGNSILAAWIHKVLFFDAPWWVFTTCYTVCGGLILLSLVCAPPDWSRLMREKPTSLSN